ncbi:TPA: hypothetical protein ACH3X1_000570 [Trebouxia sp. C0004]
MPAQKSPEQLAIDRTRDGTLEVLKQYAPHVAKNEPVISFDGPNNTFVFTTRPRTAQDGLPVYISVHVPVPRRDAKMQDFIVAYRRVIAYLPKASQGRCPCCKGRLDFHEYRIREALSDIEVVYVLYIRYKCPNKECQLGFRTTNGMSDAMTSNGKYITVEAASMLQNAGAERINNQQLANLWNSQARAVYFWARLLWVSIQLEMRQGTVLGCFGPRPDPFPEYDTVASGHLAITVPTYLRSTFSGDLVRSRFGYFSYRWVTLKKPANACRLRARVVHLVPPAEQLASAMLQVSLKYVYVMDPSTGERLLTWKAKKTTVKQIRLVLNNGLSDPTVEGLVYKITDMASQGQNSSRSSTAGAPTPNETVNRPLKDAMPPRCSAAYFTTQFFFYITPYNLREGHERLGEPFIGCYDLLLVHKVSEKENRLFGRQNTRLPQFCRPELQPGQVLPQEAFLYDAPLASVPVVAERAQAALENMGAIPASVSADDSLVNAALTRMEDVVASGINAPTTPEKQQLAQWKMANGSVVGSVEGIESSRELRSWNGSADRDQPVSGSRPVSSAQH